jgi:hypothetical protein
MSYSATLCLFMRHVLNVLFIPFRVSRFPLRTIMGNGERERRDEKIMNTIYTPFCGADQSLVYKTWLIK